VNADELDAAREAVSATRTWRNQMRADWGTSFREPEEVLDEAVGELLADRDHWRFLARREAAELDRLRAVVAEALPVLRHVTDTLRDSDGGPLDAWGIADETARLYRSLAALDVSPDMGGRDCECPRPNPDCEHPTCPRSVGVPE
jgi:hypothetical protein